MRGRVQSLKDRIIGGIIDVKEYKSIQLRCTGCSIHRRFSTDEGVPERFRNGCPNCGSRLSVEWKRY